MLEARGASAFTCNRRHGDPCHLVVGRLITDAPPVMFSSSNGTGHGPVPDDSLEVEDVGCSQQRQEGSAVNNAGSGVLMSH